MNQQTLQSTHFDKKKFIRLTKPKSTTAGTSTNSNCAKTVGNSPSPETSRSPSGTILSP